MSAQGQQRQYLFRSEIGTVYMDRRVKSHLEQAVGTAASMYPEEVPATLANVIDRSFANIVYHNPEEFVEYGDYRILDLIVKQADIDAIYRRKTRPHIVVLYGPPGTGKTTWVRNAVAKYLIWKGMLTGIYLEVTPGDFSSKFAGVPVAFLKSLVNTVSVTDFASVLLFDEADGILLKPRDASGGIEIEQHKLVSELKSALSILLSMHYPLVVVFTTNYKDTIVKADPALADRVTAWVEVLPPPNWAKIAMAKNLLPSALRCLWEGAPGFLYATVFRAVRRGAEPPTLNPLWAGNPWLPFKIPWVVPVLPYEADFLIGYLIAWGWNPLDKDLADALTIDFSRAVALWDKGNPLLKVYGRGIASEIEMMRRYDEEKNKIEKSFLRSFHAAKRGADEFEKILTISYKQFWSDAMLEYRELTMGEEAARSLEWKKDQIVCSLMVHGVPPSLIHHSISKSLPFKQFIDMVNQVLSTIGIVTNPIRHLFLPFMVSYTEDPLMRFAEFRRKIGVYNKLVYRELKEGRLLEPIRIMLLEKDLEKAWSEARKSFDGLDEDVKPYVGTALTAVKILHRAIHTADLEEKGIVLLKTYKDGDEVMNTVIKIADELGIKRWLHIVLDTKSFAPGGITVHKADDWYIFDPTFFNAHIADETGGTTIYTIAPIVERLGHYIVDIVRDLTKEEELESQKNAVS